MSALKKSLILVIPVSFIFGLWWGVTLFNHRIAARMAGLQEINILTYEGLIPESLLTSFEKQTKIPLTVTVAKSPEDLWFKLMEDTGNFDVVTLMSYQVSQAVLNNQLAVMKGKLLSRREDVSADFLSIPNFHNAHFLVPLAWGLNGFVYDPAKIKEKPDSWDEVFSNPALRKKVLLLNSPMELYFSMGRRKLAVPEWLTDENVATLKKPLLELFSFASLSPRALTALPQPQPSATPTAEPEWKKYAVIQMSNGEAGEFLAGPGKGWEFVIPKESASFWTLSLAILKDSEAIEESHRLLDFLLDEDNSLEIAKSFHQATTNKLLEDSDLPAMMKASYVRQVPLTRMQFVQDFVGGQAMTELIIQLLKGKVDFKDKAPEAAPKAIAPAAPPRPAKTQPAQTPLPLPPPPPPMSETVGDEPEAEP